MKRIKATLLALMLISVCFMTTIIIVDVVKADDYSYAYYYVDDYSNEWNMNNIENCFDGDNETFGNPIDEAGGTFYTNSSTATDDMGTIIKVEIRAYVQCVGYNTIIIEDDDGYVIFTYEDDGYTDWEETTAHTTWDDVRNISFVVNFDSDTTKLSIIEVKVTYEPPLAIDVELSFSNWNAGNPDLGTNAVLSSLTLWQNGTANVDVSIGVNATNFTFVSYNTWAANGHLQYCMNYTVNGTEYNMADVTYPFTNSLASDMAPGSLSFALRLWMPKSILSETKREDFKIVFIISEAT